MMFSSPAVYLKKTTGQVVVRSQSGAQKRKERDRNKQLLQTLDSLLPPFQGKVHGSVRRKIGTQGRTLEDILTDTITLVKSHVKGEGTEADSRAPSASASIASASTTPANSQPLVLPSSAANLVYKEIFQQTDNVGFFIGEWNKSNDWTIREAGPVLDKLLANFPVKTFVGQHLGFFLHPHDHNVLQDLAGKAINARDGVATGMLQHGIPKKETEISIRGNLRLLCGDKTDEFGNLSLYYRRMDTQISVSWEGKDKRLKLLLLMDLRSTPDLPEWRVHFNARRLYKGLYRMSGQCMSFDLDRTDHNPLAVSVALKRILAKSLDKSHEPVGPSRGETGSASVVGLIAPGLWLAKQCLRMFQSRFYFDIVDGQLNMTWYARGHLQKLFQAVGLEMPWKRFGKLKLGDSIPDAMYHSGGNWRFFTVQGQEHPIVLGMIFLYDPELGRERVIYRTDGMFDSERVYCHAKVPWKTDQNGVQYLFTKPGDSVTGEHSLPSTPWLLDGPEEAWTLKRTPFEQSDELTLTALNEMKDIGLNSAFIKFKR